MALHDNKSVRDQMDDDVYASVDLSVSMPKYKFPSVERDPRHAYSVVHDELMLDGNARQNLATFCQTWEEPEIHQLMDDCIDKNIVDKDEYPQIAEIEARCVICYRTCGIRPPMATRLAVLPQVPVRQPCWEVWP